MRGSGANGELSRWRRRSVCRAAFPSSPNVVVRARPRHLISRSQSDQLTWNGLQLKLKQRMFIFTEKLSLIGRRPLLTQFLCLWWMIHWSWSHPGHLLVSRPLPLGHSAHQHNPQNPPRQTEETAFNFTNSLEQAILDTLVDKRSFWAIV